MQKLRIPPIVWLVLILAGVFWVIGWKPKPPTNNRTSLGDKLLLSDNPTDDKKTGIEDFSKGDYQGAIAAFQKSLTKHPNDPETLIYLNNAQAQDKNPLKIAMGIPISNNINVAQEMLRGVAMAQKEINQNGGINGRWLQVEIVNDENNPKIAEELAGTLVKDNSILAVVGPNASNASLPAAPVYQKGGLVEITPTSYADSLSGIGSYIFRTVPNTRTLAEPLAQYMLKTAHQTKVAVCYDSQAPDTASFKDQFVAAFSSKGGHVVPTVCNLDVPTFNAKVAIADAVSSGADSLLLCPHVDRLEKAIDLAQANQGRLGLFGPPVLNTIRTLQLGQGDVKGLVLSVPWSPKIGAAQAFAKQALQQWGGDVSWRTASAYDTTRAIIVGLQQNQTRDGLQSTLRSPGFVATGINGEVRFLPTGDRAGKAILIQVQSTPSGYEFVPIQP